MWEDRIDKSIKNLVDALLGIHYGAITPSFIDTFKVEYYGQPTPIKHLAITISKNNQVIVTPHDKAILFEISKVLEESGFIVHSTKQNIVISVPKLSHKEDVIKQIKKMGEDAKIAVRNIRRQARKEIDKITSEDYKSTQEQEIDKLLNKAELDIINIINYKISKL